MGVTFLRESLSNIVGLDNTLFMDVCSDDNSRIHFGDSRRVYFPLPESEVLNYGHYAVEYTSLSNDSCCFTNTCTRHLRYSEESGKGS